MSHCRSAKGSACGCSRRGRGAGQVPKHRHHSPLLYMPRLGRRTRRPCPLFRSRDRAAFAVSGWAEMFISAVLCQVLPRHRRSSAGVPARKGEPRRAASTPALASSRRTGQYRANPKEAAFLPTQRVRVLMDPFAPPAVPGRSSARPAWRRRACAAQGGTARSSAAGGRSRAGRCGTGGGSTRMKDMDNIKTVKKEWVCKSGTDDQILNGTEQNCDYFVDNLFEEAQKVGAMCMPPTTVKNQVDVIIKLWKNGFTVNDGELRSYTDVANQQFLDSIKKGELPFELQKVFDKAEVEVKVEDKKDKVYLSSKKPMFHPFSGHGYRLGSATPKIISKVRDDHPGPDHKRHLPLVPLNDLEPITSVQIWLADGERIIQKFNVSHRISHVRDFITKYQGSEGSVPFTLTTSLPFRELQDETLTLEEAKLQNAVVVQRLRKTTEPFRLLVIKAPDNDYKSAATPNGQLKNEQKNAINSTRSN